MKLSIVIVNYNVKEFLTQCLDSIFKSQTQYDYEVIIVDNSSKDSGRDQICATFEHIIWVENIENVGFGRANNQGFSLAKGVYTLILNPDTVLQEDTIEKCVSYLIAHPKVGGLGIKGIDGSGQFLPESKRALPTPLVALWKITGLSSIFPKSSVFARYHLGHLSPDENHEVDILVGCFMMIPTKLLLSVGGFDPQYFMYGEDIDLSYELQKTGHKNIYFSESQIIHYKGESTKRGSLNYVRMFYKAMVLFAKKQFTGSSAAAYSLLIYLGIYLRAALAIAARLGKSTLTPLLDAVVLYAILNTIKSYWEQNHRFIHGGSYPDLYTYTIQGSYVLAWLFGLWLSGVYFKNNRPIVMVRSMIATTLILGFFYGLLPEELRFSRALLMLGALGGLSAMLGWRAVLSVVSGKSMFEGAPKQPRILFFGAKSSKTALDDILHASGITPSFYWEEEPKFDNEDWLLKLKALVHLHRINELIVDISQVSNQRLIGILTSLGEQTSVKSLLPENKYIIGSDSSLTQGETYRKSQQTADPQYLRQRRVFEITATSLLITLAPLTLVFAIATGRFNAWKLWIRYSADVLTGKRSLVGYSRSLSEKFNVPPLPPPIFDICSVLPVELDYMQNARAIVENYAIEARLRQDLLYLIQLSKKF
ncbi:MAG: glycosyltransferase family 2 protein [Schleiferiaceae bacterium]|nr:glycosyltransferase family 2 protein [Schleiferiaceae bacterium]